MIIALLLLLPPVLLLRQICDASAGPAGVLAAL
jgi:hypothetical protein